MSRIRLYITRQAAQLAADALRAKGMAGAHVVHHLGMWPNIAAQGYAVQCGVGMFLRESGAIA